jgi:hypothetical protein
LDKKNKKILASGLGQIVMSTPTDAVLPPTLILDRRAPRVQSRDTTVVVPPREQRMIRKRISAAWDPYEVWRTRVKVSTSPE